MRAGPLFTVYLVALFAFGGTLMPIARAQRLRDAPVFEVDAAWPRPLPNNWAVGPVSGISADTRDHIWIIHRGDAVREAGRVPAPAVIEFDPSGNVVQAWGGPGAGYDWPQQVHGITVDDVNGRVWITGNGEKDTHILAFTRAGKFVRQIGRPGLSGGSNNTGNVARATQVRVDARAREIYVSDGEQNQNHRVIVFDSETGAYKRHWGAFGNRPDDAAIGTDEAHGQFGSAVHCVRIDRGGRVYVCDRSNSRFQVFRKDGTYENTVDVPRVRDRAAGTVYDLDFSPDQKFVYVADGANQKVWILRRDEMRIVDWFGERGSAAGQFATSLHDLAVDSKGNIYTGEAAAAGRVQKFAQRPRRAATSVKELSPGALDALTNLVLDGDGDIDPAMYPAALRAEIRDYLSRSRGYRSPRKLAKDADGIAMPFREFLPLAAAHVWLCAAEFSKPGSEWAAHATEGYEKDLATALRSPSLIIRTAAEGLKARGRCSSP